MPSETRHIETVPHSLSGEPLTGYQTTTIYLPVDYTPHLSMASAGVSVVLCCVMVWMLKRMILDSWRQCCVLERMLAKQP